MHDGTVRDLCFLEDASNKSSLLISGGAGDCKIYVTDCATGTPFQALSGHSGKCINASAPASDQQTVLVTSYQTVVSVCLRFSVVVCEQY